MGRTIRRQPFQLSTKNSDYPETQSFIQVAFTGINENENLLSADQDSFSQAENVYVNDEGSLVSRPPFVCTGDKFIIERWRFGPYLLQMSRKLYYKDKDKNMVLLPDGDPGDHLFSDLYYRYELTCISHETGGKNYDPQSTSTDERFSNWHWDIPLSAQPASTDLSTFSCVQMNHRIFCWFGGTSLVAFDTQGDEHGRPFFVDGRRFLYFPLHELVINGMTTKLEGKNIFLNGYRRRHQLSALSQVEFADFSSPLNVWYKNGKDTEDFLYTLEEPSSIDSFLLAHPHINNAKDYLFDIVSTVRSTVILRYSRDYKRIGVSFGTSIFHTLPPLEEILSEPMLTRDGLWVVAFTTQGLAKCQIAAQDGEFLVADEIFSWEITPYPSYSGPIDTYDIVDRRFRPIGYFETIDNFVYVFAPKQFSTESSPPRRLYAEWLNGADTAVYNAVLDREVSDQIRIGFSFISPDGESDRKMQIVLLANDNNSAFLRAFIAESGQDHTLDDTGTYTLGDKYFYNVRHAAIQLYKMNGVRKIDNNIVYTLNIAAGVISGNARQDLIGTARLYGTTIDQSELTYFDTEHANKYALSEDGTVALSDQRIFYEGDRTKHLPRYTQSTRLQNGDLVSYTVNRVTRTFRVHKVNDSGTQIRSGEILSGDIIVLSAVTARDAHEFLLPTNEVTYNETARIYESVSNRYKIEGGTGDGIYSGDEITLTPIFGEQTTLAPLAPGNIYSERLRFTEGPSVKAVCSIEKSIDPIAVGENATWLAVDGKLWTSALYDTDILELEEYVGDGALNSVIPVRAATLGDTYFSFCEDGRELLGFTSPRQDNNRQKIDLLYADADDEEEFVEKITALHPLSDTTLGIFTEWSVWYIAREIDSAGNLVHTRATRSKIPAGCRDGNDVVTALDGQAIIFATPRGVAALAPQDFVATTEKTMTYLSDKIEKLYRHFYDDDVENVRLYQEREIAYRPMVKIQPYKYWLLFYRYMDREILVLDTRNSAWWRWTTQYPIQQMMGDGQLKLILRVDFPTLASKSSVYKSHFGVVFTLDDTGAKSLYEDEYVPQSLNGFYRIDYANQFHKGQLVAAPAQSMIRWSFASQKLHLNVPQNYKAVKSLSLNLRGDQVKQFRLVTKIYRDLFHPRAEEMVETLVNDVRAFVKPVNFLHVVNFQYALTSTDAAKPLCIDSFGIKYEVKERIR